MPSAPAVAVRRLADHVVIQFELDGSQVEVADDVGTLLDALRGPLARTSVKDGCSPQGQCGCCTVLIDGKPRVACVTPARRVAGRSVVTLDGLPDETRQTWAEAFFAAGASQCGFCSPGIIVRLEALRREGRLDEPTRIEHALAAHVCRCTGYQPIVEACGIVASGSPASPGLDASDRNVDHACQRAGIEGACAQSCGPEIALGSAPFADDTAPPEALVMFPAAEGAWVLAESLPEARLAAAKVQGRNTTKEALPPFPIPDWPDAVVRFATSWVEPAYVEPDCSWATPGGTAATPLSNGGAFGGKESSPVAALAESTANETGRAVRVVYPREEVVRAGPKRPPLAIAIDANGEGIVVVPACDGIDDVVHSVFPDVVVRHEPVTGPPVSLALRGAVWAEMAAASAVISHDANGADAAFRVAVDGGWAEVSIGAEGIDVRVSAGQALDHVTLRSYCIGAVHMACGMVWTEGLAIGDDGVPLDLTFRSFGLLRPGQLPPVSVSIEDVDTPPVAIGDAVFAATLAAAWDRAGRPPAWPTGIPAFAGR